METKTLPPPPPAPRRHPAQIALLAVAAVVVIGLLGWGLKSLLGGAHERPRKPPTVTLLPDKPPPPPPKEEKKPEPKEEKKEIRNEPPKEAPPAQNEPLKMEGPAGDGGSPFAGGSVGRDYIGGNIGSALHSAYSARLQRHLQEELNRNRKLRESDYRSTVRIWLRRDGTVEKAELAPGTGNATLDQLLRETLLQVAAMREGPPEDMPQPIRIRITARSAG
jgi:protein TonB